MSSIPKTLYLRHAGEMVLTRAKKTMQYTFMLKFPLLFILFLNFYGPCSNGFV